MVYVPLEIPDCGWQPKNPHNLFLAKKVMSVISIGSVIAENAAAP
jgi:hypothetical protein